MSDNQEVQRAIRKTQRKVKENFSYLANQSRYLMINIINHERCLQENNCFHDFMAVAETIHMWALQGVSLITNFPLTNDESEEESFIEETEESEEDNSEDVIFLGTNYENDEKEN